MNTFKTKIVKTIALLAATFIFVSCSEKTEDDGVITPNTSIGIPKDRDAKPNPPIEQETTHVPNIQYTIEKEKGYIIMRIDMTGIQDPETLEWIKLLGTGDKGQNVWVSVDDKPKGIEVYNNSDDDANKTITADLVFLVDNSGSMSEEADAIARDIVAWAGTLASSNLDIRFGCVGYDGAITGAMNLTTLEYISSYLNHSSGTSRTVGFDGSDALQLKNASPSYTTRGDSWAECGMAALRFADENFTFRNGSNRIYVNFTDEPNQPNGKNGFSVEYLNDQTNWDASQGTIHTVYSDYDTTFTVRYLYDEKPWLMSRYTGGTELYASSSFTGVSLNDLPVTGAMQNAYIIRFTNIDEFMDGKEHAVKITVLSEDKNVQAEKIFYIIFGEKTTQEKPDSGHDSDKNNSKNILGSWLFTQAIWLEEGQTSTESGYNWQLTFNADGTFTEIDGTDTYKGTYTIQDLTVDELVLNYEDGSSDSYKIEKMEKKELVFYDDNSYDGKKPGDKLYWRDTYYFKKK